MAILIVDAETPKQEQITGSESSNSIFFSIVWELIFNKQMDDFSLQDKPLLRLILNLFHQVSRQAVFAVWKCRLPVRLNSTSFIS